MAAGRDKPCAAGQKKPPKAVYNIFPAVLLTGEAIDSVQIAQCFRPHQPSLGVQSEDSKNNYKYINYRPNVLKLHFLHFLHYLERAIKIRLFKGAWLNVYRDKKAGAKTIFRCERTSAYGKVSVTACYSSWTGKKKVKVKASAFSKLPMVPYYHT